MKIVNESLMDKLVGPTKEKIEHDLKENFSQDAIDWLTDLVKQMKPIDKGNKVVYYIGDKWYMYKYNTSDILRYNYDRIWAFLNHIYGYNNKINDLVKYVVETNTNLKDIKPYGLEIMGENIQ